MNMLRAVLISFAFVLPMAAVVQTAQAATLSWELPTTYSDDAATPLPPSEIASIKVYRQGNAMPVATLPGNATTYVVPSCQRVIYVVTATATNGFESDASNPGEVIPLRSKCAPKSPTGLTVSGG